jgi:hypothetical protein
MVKPVTLEQTMTLCERSIDSHQYVDAVRLALRTNADNWAEAAILRDGAWGSVEDALIWCMFYLWAAENLNDV